MIFFVENFEFFGKFDIFLSQCFSSVFKMPKNFKIIKKINYFKIPKNVQSFEIIKNE